MRAALYKRVSSQMQVREGYSLAFQEDIMRHYCDQNNLSVAHVYEDGGRTGSNTDREGLQALVADAKLNAFDVVLIFRVDRFSRDPLDLLYLVQELHRRGIILKSVTESVDASDPAGELMLTILGAIGKFVRANILQNAMLGKKTRAQHGRYTGGKCPFGYIVGEDGHYIPDATLWWNDISAAALIPLMFEKFLRASVEEGRGLRGVTRWLNTQGVPSPTRTHNGWNPTGLRQILRNPVYTGDFVYSKTQQPLHKNMTPRPQAEWIVSPSAHEPLVPRAIWEQAQTQLDQNRTAPPAGPQNPHTWLSGFLRCSLCDAALVVRYTGPNRRYVHFTCGSRYNEARKRHDTACAFPFIRSRDLQDAVWAAMTEVATDPAMVTKLLSLETANQYLAAIDKRLDTARHTIDQCDLDEDRLMTVLLQGVFKPELVTKKVEHIHAKREEAERQVTALSQERDGLVKAQPFLAANPDEIRHYLRQVFQEGDLSDSNRRRILEVLVGAGGITVTPDRLVQIHLRVAAAVLQPPGNFVSSETASYPQVLRRI